MTMIHIYSQIICIIKKTKLEQIIREVGDKETVMQPRGRAGGIGQLAPLGHLSGPQAGKGLHPPRHRL